MRKAVQSAICPPDDCCPPDTKGNDVVTRPQAEQRLADFFRALGHPARVRIFRTLLEKDVCIAGELAEELPLAASTVSQHLKILKEVGLIKGEIDGPRRCYCVDKTVAHELNRLVQLLWIVS